MRLCALPIVVVLISQALSFSQEQSLGDLARDTRARKSQLPHAAKVLNNDEGNEKPLSATDDPGDVLMKAELALLNGMPHRCRSEITNNSGPGSAETSVTEVAGRDRIHEIANQTRPDAVRVELIVVDNDGYRRKGNNPWEKLDATEVSRVRPPYNFQVGGKSRYDGWDVKLVGQEVIDGIPVFLYRFIYHTVNFDRSINALVGVNDGLLRKWDRLSVSREIESGPITTHETIFCTYGEPINIQLPK